MLYTYFKEELLGLQRVIITKLQVYALNMIEPPCTERYARWSRRSVGQPPTRLEYSEWLFISFV